MPTSPQDDKDFLAADPADQIRYLAATDPDFKAASPEDQAAYLAHVTNAPTAPGQGRTNDAKPGFLDSVEQDVIPAAKALGTVALGPLGMAYAGAKKDLDNLRSVRETGETPEELHNDEQKTEGYGKAYRYVTTPLAESVGVNVRGMEDAARKGNTAGVLGHIVVPAATAVSAPAIEGLSGSPAFREALTSDESFVGRSPNYLGKDTDLIKGPGQFTPRNLPKQTVSTSEGAAPSPLGVIPTGETVLGPEQFSRENLPTPSPKANGEEAVRPLNDYLGSAIDTTGAVRDAEITPQQVKSSPGTSMSPEGRVEQALIPEPNKPRSPLGNAIASAENPSQPLTADKLEQIRDLKTSSPLVDALRSESTEPPAPRPTPKAVEDLLQKGLGNEPEHLGQFARANGQAIDEAIPETKEGDALRSKLHDLSNVQLRQLAISAGEDMGQNVISRGKFGGTVSRPEIFERLLKNHSAEDLGKMVDEGKHEPQPLSKVTEDKMDSLGLSEASKTAIRNSGMDDASAQQMLAKLTKRQLESLAETAGRRRIRR